MNDPVYNILDTIKNQKLLNSMQPASGRVIAEDYSVKNYADLLTTDGDGNQAIRIMLNGGDAVLDNLIITGDLEVQGTFIYGEEAVDILTITGYIRGYNNRPVHIGSCASAQGLTDINDLVVCGDLEVQGTIYGTINETDPIFTAWLSATPPAYQSQLSNYLFLPGTPGGQSAYGGSASGENLTLYSNPYQDGWVNIGGMARIADSYGQFQIGLPALPLASSPQFLVRGHISDPATGAFASFINSDNQNVLTAVSYPNGLGGNARTVLIGDTPTIVDPLHRVKLFIYENSTYGVAQVIQNGNAGILGTSNYIALSDNSTVPITDYVPTNAVLFGRTNSGWADPSYTLFNSSSGYAYTSDGDFFTGAGRSGNLYLFAGSIADKTAIKLSISGTTGNVGIGLGGSTLASFPLQVAGRARFNDSIGIDTDPSTFGMDIRGSINYVGSMKPVNGMSAALAGVAGNIDNGTHRYRVSYYTDLGETQLSNATTNVTITDKTSNGQINLTNIPVSTDTKVTGRRIYRTLANTTASYYLLVDIPNNTSTTYTDNTADADLGDYDNSNRDNTTRGRIRIDGNQVGFFGDYNTGLGISSLGNGANIPGYYNFALGNFALYNLVNGVQNSAIGAFAGLSIVDGTSNMLAGFNSGRTMVSATGNTFYGVNTGYSATGNYNTIYGYDAGYRLGSSDAWALTTGSYNLFMGYQSGLGSATQRDYATAIGYKARVDKDYGIVLGGTGTDAPWVGINTTTPNSRLQVAGSFSAGYVEKTANYTLTENDYTVNCTSGTFTITLPTAVGIQGRIYNIKNTGTGVITVTPNGAETIDGDASEVVNEDENLQIQSTNAGWIIL